MRELIMLTLVAVSLLTTPPGVREDNQFNYAAIIEVAALFVGIFIAMQVPLDVLRVYGKNLGLTEPWHFFWATGSLSSVLDNAPTYVVFFETANSLEAGTRAHTVIRPDLLAGISLGAVFMGAMTYIGNGPNFMVKAIAEQSGIRMPSFFGYVFKYSAVFLLPVFVIVTFLIPDGGAASAPVPSGDHPALVAPADASPGPAEGHGGGH
jgi:Na+/H+ antiporter NhaD/arsenite permease-like protein